MEAALAIGALVAVLLLGTVGLAAVSLQVRCVDAAREAARLAARGDSAAVSAGDLVPAGTSLELRHDGRYVVARVSGHAPLLPGFVIAGQAVAAAEP